MTYHNATKYILNAPDELHEHTPGARLRMLWNQLGNPHKHLKYLRLAGSNGKTVCAEMLMSVFQQSPYTVGFLAMSIQPEVRSSIRINGIPIPFDDIADLVDRVRQTVIRLNKETEASHEESYDSPALHAPASELVLTKYEILLTAAILAFQQNGCSFCLIESDHGNADPTRFLPAPFAAAICGTIPSEDRKEIQGIRSYISHGIQEIVSAPQNQEAYQVISQTCAVINCRLTIPTKSQVNIQKLTLSGSDFSYKGKPYRLSLCGKFQITNATVVLEILEMLARRGYQVNEQQIYDGLRQTKIPSKFEILAVAPTIIADSTHSDVAVKTVCDSMADFRPMIGSKIRLCLPEGSIVERYVQVLQDMEYSIETIITLAQEQPSDLTAKISLAHTKKIHQTVKQALSGLANDEILLISGPYGFTAEIRYEILKVLGL